MDGYLHVPLPDGGQALYRIFKIGPTPDHIGATVKINSDDELHVGDWHSTPHASASQKAMDECEHHYAAEWRCRKRDTLTP